MRHLAGARDHQYDRRTLQGPGDRDLAGRRRVAQRHGLQHRVGPGGFPQLNEVGGGLDAAQFVANPGGNPTNGNQRIVYDTLTGDLFLDPDGNASDGDQVLIVTLTNKPTITIEAFEVWV